jgi:hypothetical protein
MADQFNTQPKNSLAELLSNAITNGGGGAAFGVFPQMKPRRQGNPADSANLPVDVVRGRLAGLLGLPADMANLVRSPSPIEMFGDTSYEAPAQFPYTTDKFLKDLPLAPTSRVGQLAGQAASFVPLNPMPAVRGVQKIGQMAGEELAATMMGQRPGSMMSKVVPQPLFAVPPEQGLFQAKPQAPVSDIGFYSAAEQAALNLARNKGTGQSFINDLMKAPDVKKEELAYTGLDDFLANKPNVTKQEVQDFLGNNRVAVKEVVSGAPIVEDPLGIAKRKAVFDKYEPEIQDLYRRIDKPEYVVYDPETNKVLKNYTNYDDALLDNLDPMGAFAKTKTALRPKENSRQLQQQLTDIQNLRDAQADALYTIPESAPTKFGKFQLPGGENYREIRLTLPNKPMDAGMAAENWYTQFIKRGGDSDWSQLHPDRRQEIMNSMPAEARNLSASPEYRSSHFDEPNILAHMRVNDRIDADGKKMLLVEEIQSDWHQAGRERGYKTKESLEKWYSQNKLDDDPSFADLNSEQRSVIERNRNAGMGSDSAVPDAPFKDTWYQLALKRLTKYAADNGYERIGLTTGQQQAGRYALSNEVDEINVIGRTDARTGEKSRSVALDLKSGGTYKLGVNNEGIIDNVNMLEINNLQGKKLADVVGKDIAKQIMEGSSQTIKGEGLNIGGEGMMKYYDEIYPKYLDKYGKKYGAKVGETQVNTVMQRADNSMIPKMGQEPVRYLDVTPEMKQGTSKGQPLFAAVPALPIATMDYTDPFPDTTR